MPDCKDNFVEEVVAAAKVIVVAEKEASTSTLPILVPYSRPQLTERMSRAGDKLIKNSTNLTKTSVTKLWISTNNAYATRA